MNKIQAFTDALFPTRSKRRMEKMKRDINDLLKLMDDKIDSLRKQSESISQTSPVTLFKWLDENQFKMTVRLYNGLRVGIHKFQWNDETKLCDIKKKHIDGIQNLGLRSWEEFKKLRGY